MVTSAVLTHKKYVKYNVDKGRNVPSLGMSGIESRQRKYDLYHKNIFCYEIFTLTEQVCEKFEAFVFTATKPTICSYYKTHILPIS